MGKLNERDNMNDYASSNKRARLLNDFDLLSDNSVSAGKVDWQQMFASFKDKTVEDIVAKLMQNLDESDNIEFDQISILLKHYLINDELHDLFLNHFLTFNRCGYVSQLVERFNRSETNTQWMISELFKIIICVSNEQQTKQLISNSEPFQNFLFVSLFNEQLLDKLKSLDHGLSMTELAILVNILDSIANLCELNTEFISRLDSVHIDWLVNALVNKRNSFELNNSLTNLFLLLSQSTVSLTSKALNRMVELFFTNASMSVLDNSIDFLSKSHHHHHQQHQQQQQLPSLSIACNLNAKLNLVGAHINILLNESIFIDKLNKTSCLVELMAKYGYLFEYVLNEIKLNEKELHAYLAFTTSSEASSNNEMSATDADDQSETNANSKQLIKLAEHLIDSKLLTIDLFRSVCCYFSKNDITDEDDDANDEWEEINSDDESSNAKSMEEDIDMNARSQKIDANKPVDNSEREQFEKLALERFKIASGLLDTICHDNECLFQDDDRDRIGHIYNSIKLMRNEALQLFTIVLDMATRKSSLLISVDWLLALLRLLAEKTPGDLRLIQNENDSNNNKQTINDDTLTKLCELIHDLFAQFNESNDKRAISSLSLDTLGQVVNFIKEILYKYQTSSPDLCVRMGRILVLLAIRLRDKSNLVESASLLQLSATILVEMTAATFDMMDQSQIETLKLNAELLDFLIDLFSEDSLVELEHVLGFVERMKSFSDRFYAKCKQFRNKQANLNKNDSILIKTVKDNLKPFIQYKLQSSNK